MFKIKEKITEPNSESPGMYVVDLITKAREKTGRAVFVVILVRNIGVALQSCWTLAVMVVVATLDTWG